QLPRRRRELARARNRQKILQIVPCELPHTPLPNGCCSPCHNICTFLNRQCSKIVVRVRICQCYRSNQGPSGGTNRAEAEGSPSRGKRPAPSEKTASMEDTVRFPWRFVELLGGNTS